MGVHVETLDFGTDSTIDFEAVRTHLRADKVGRIKAIMAVHVDTSTSIRNDIGALSKVITDTGHDALLMVDCIASLGCDEFLMDDWGILWSPPVRRG